MNKTRELNTILIENDTKSFTEQLKKNYLSFDNEIIAKFDDFYWDIKVRCEKYTDHISQFQNTIYDILKRNGCLDKLKDLLSLFDSKNNIKSSIINYFNINDNEIGPNKDIENTVFLMNFELMNLCDNKKYTNN